jgi:hypothetical protein
MLTAIVWTLRRQKCTTVQREALPRAMSTQGTGCWGEIECRTRDTFCQTRTGLGARRLPACTGRASWKLEAGSWKLEAGSWKLEAGSWKLEAGSWKLEAGSWKLEAGS